MTDAKRRVIERFPDREATIHRLVDTNAAFNALCQEYGAVTDSLNRLQDSGEGLAEADRLRQRRAALDEEMLALMQQTARV